MLLCLLALNEEFDKGGIAVRTVREPVTTNVLRFIAAAVSKAIRSSVKILFGRDVTQLSQDLGHRPDVYYH